VIGVIKALAKNCSFVDFGYYHNPIFSYQKHCRNNMSLNKDSHQKHRWFVDNYGTRRGALLTYRHRVLSILGKYHVYRKIDWDSVDRLVFVCKGNICRSAYAEVVAKSIGVESISCGIDTVTGKPANEMALKTSATRGFDLGKHKTTTVQSLTFEKTDLLLAMEPWQSKYLVDNLPVGSQCTLCGAMGYTGYIVYS
jgi:protein-tyrosine phosphatase